MARKKTLEQIIIELILEHGILSIESALRMYKVTMQPVQKQSRQKSKAKVATATGTTVTGAI